MAQEITKDVAYKTVSPACIEWFLVLATELVHTNLLRKVLKKEDTNVSAHNDI